MLDEALAALAAAGGTAVVQAAGTDAWIGFRTRMARLLGRGDNQRERAELARLDQTAASLAEASPSDAERLRLHHEVAWQTRLEILLEGLTIAERIRFADELRDLINSACDAIGSVNSGASGITVGRNLLIESRDRSISAGIIYGDVSEYHAAPEAPDPGRIQHVTERELKRRHAAIIEAAYHRFLGAIPRPKFTELEWRPSPQRITNRLLAGVTFEPVEPAYRASSVDSMLYNVGQLTLTSDKIYQLSAYLGRCSDIERVRTPSQHKDRAYSKSEVDSYLTELHERLNVFFQDCSTE